MIDVRVIDVHGKRSVVGSTIWIRHLFVVTYLHCFFPQNKYHWFIPKKLFVTRISYFILVYVQQYL